MADPTFLPLSPWTVSPVQDVHSFPFILESVSSSSAGAGLPEGFQGGYEASRREWQGAICSQALCEAVGETPERVHSSEHLFHEPIRT